MAGMMRMCLVRSVVIGGCLLVVASLTGCSDLELESTWRDRDIVIDGDARDWRGLTTYVEKGNIAVGVTNDRRDLFLCLHSPTREVAAQIVMRGLTVWFDPDGGTGRTLGIRCTIGMQDMPRPGEAMTDREKMREMVLERVGEAASEVEILGPDDQVYGRFPVGDLTGLEIAVAYTGGRIVYELKLPLTKTEDSPYALGVNWEKKVSIGFVTPEIDMGAMREAVRESMDDRQPPGGGGRGGGVPGGGMPGGGPSGGMRGGVPEPLDLWCKANLTPGREGRRQSPE
jgi:hypothetical protein